MSTQPANKGDLTGRPRALGVAHEHEDAAPGKEGRPLRHAPGPKTQSRTAPGTPDPVKLPRFRIVRASGTIYCHKAASSWRQR